ncbi:MAG: hypothetical protein IPJ98_02615 [Bryobacterales bacterium]|nr:hypothetical protein [Bryobacterales bacterium]
MKFDEQGLHAVIVAEVYSSQHVIALATEPLGEQLVGQGERDTWRSGFTAKLQAEAHES